MAGKVVIVTGASQPIGADLVAAYRARGWAVVAGDRVIKPSDDPDVLTVEGEITGPGSAGRIVGAALGQFGRLDTLVYNAGLSMSKSFADYTTVDYASVVGASLTGFFWLAQRAITEMAGRYGGHVVSVSAPLAEARDPGASAVLAALARGALAAATRSLAIEYAALGIRVNAVFPGVIQTSMRAPGSYEARLPPLGRVGQVSDVVGGVLFLESSPYITGEILHIDGGQLAGHCGAMD